MTYESEVLSDGPVVWAPFDLEDARRRMVTRMPTLTEFLLARIAEDEAMAQWALRDGYATDRPLQYAETGHNTLPDLTIDPARLLAECEAKRRIVEGITKGTAGEGTRRFVLSSLALPYADHPDFDPAWRP